MAGVALGSASGAESRAAAIFTSCRNSRFALDSRSNAKLQICLGAVATGDVDRLKKKAKVKWRRSVSGTSLVTRSF